MSDPKVSYPTILCSTNLFTATFFVCVKFCHATRYYVMFSFVIFGYIMLTVFPYDVRLYFVTSYCIVLYYCMLRRLYHIVLHHAEIEANISSYRVLYCMISCITL